MACLAQPRPGGGAEWARGGSLGGVVANAYCMEAFCSPRRPAAAITRHGLARTAHLLSEHEHICPHARTEASSGALILLGKLDGD